MSRASPEKAGRRAAADRAASGLLWLLGLLTLIYFAWPVWRAQWPLEIDVNEAWNAYWADAVKAGAPLYPPPSDLIVNNYPPLSFLLLGSLERLGFDPVIVGRLLSLAATLATGAAAAACVSLLGGTRTAGVVAGLVYVAVMARFFDRYVGVNDPHIVALAIMALAMAWFLRAKRSGRALEPAFLLMVLAGFYKHSLIAIPATSFLWLLIESPARAWRPALIGTFAAVAGLGLCAHLFGRDFIDNLMAPRVTTIGRALASTGRLQWIAPALAISAVWVVRDWPAPAARFVALFIATALGVHLLQQTGEGVADNSQFELLFAGSIGVGLAFDFVGSARSGSSDVWSKTAILSVIVIRLLFSLRAEPYLLLSSSQFRDLGPTLTAVEAAETRRVQAIAGNVSCSIMTVCRQAGKPFVYDDFNMQQRLAAGRVTVADLQAAIAARGIVSVRIDPVASADMFREGSRGG